MRISGDGCYETRLHPLAQPQQKLKRIISEELADAHKSEITGCNFVGVQFDARAVDAVQTIAEGLVTNAEALKQLAYVLKASHVHIESLLRIDAKERDK